MINRKVICLSGILLYVFLFLLTGCDFEDPYVPDYAGSSTLTGGLTSNPPINLDKTQVLLRGEDSFSTITDTKGEFSFRDLPPGDYILFVQKSPYIQENFQISIPKSREIDLGKFQVSLKGAVTGYIPDEKLATLEGELEIVIYIDGTPLIIDQSEDRDFIIDLKSTKSDIDIQAETKINVYIDDEFYSAKVNEDGNFIIDFIPPGIYNRIWIRLNSTGKIIPIASDSPIIIRSGETRLLKTPAN
ncbi:DUF2012 domain-containing protein [Candidatus Poribacteria bacterium]|nr:DUF2012 domain-containing protein [Candidatus Poribacteria bacterium]